jgi:hypothetical protein
MWDDGLIEYRIDSITFRWQAEENYFILTTNSFVNKKCDTVAKAFLDSYKTPPATGLNANLLSFSPLLHGPRYIACTVPYNYSRCT